MAHKVVLSSASPLQQTPSPTDISPRMTHKNLPRCGAQAPGCFLPKGSWGQALKISDSSLKTSHPWAEASVVVCTGARPLDKDCFSSQNLTCVCSDWMPILPLNLPACNAQTAFLYRMDTSISLGWFQPWPWTSLQKQRRRAEVFENRRGNNQHNHSTTVQLKGRDCTRWTGEKF